MAEWRIWAFPGTRSPVRKAFLGESGKQEGGASTGGWDLAAELATKSQASAWRPCRTQLLEGRLIALSPSFLLLR